MTVAIISRLRGVVSVSKRIKIKRVRDADVPTWPLDTEYMVHMALALKKKEAEE